MKETCLASASVSLSKNTCVPEVAFKNKRPSLGICYLQQQPSSFLWKEIACESNRLSIFIVHITRSRNVSHRTSHSSELSNNVMTSRRCVLVLARPRSESWSPNLKPSSGMWESGSFCTSRLVESPYWTVRSKSESLKFWLHNQWTSLETVSVSS